MTTSTKAACERLFELMERQPTRTRREPAITAPRPPWQDYAAAMFTIPPPRQDDAA